MGTFLSGVRSPPGAAQLPCRRRKPEEHRPPALSAFRPRRAPRAPGRPAGTPLWRCGAPAAERLERRYSPRPAGLLLLPRRPPTLAAAGLGRLGASARTKEAPAAPA